MAKKSNNRPVGRPRKHQTVEDAYRENVEQTTERKNLQSALARDLFKKIPKVADPKRRKRTKNNFVEFCRVYGWKTFKQEFSPVQLAIADRITDAVLNGGKKAFAVFRRGRKTSTTRWGLLWAILQRHCDYVIYLGSTDEATKRTFLYFQQQIFQNDRLLEDFPEVFFPLRETKGSSNKGLLYNGDRFLWKISSDDIVFPMIPGFELSGRRIDFRSINSGAIRGADHTIFGEPKRPSLVIADDFMSDESAGSDIQNDDMYDKFMGTIDYLSGIDDEGFVQPLPVLALGTCIEPNDAMSRLLDQEVSPDYRGEIFPRVLSMPDDLTLWMKYREVRKVSLQKKGTIDDATEFYRLNRAAMDSGCVVSSPDERERHMLSGIQYAMDSWAKNERKFWTEQQNSPTKAREAGGGFLTPSMVLDKVIDLPRCHVPEGTAAMTAFVDVGIHYLNYEVIAFGEKMKFSHVVDYGVFPDQGTPFVSKKNYAVDIQDVYTTGGENEKLQSAIVDLLELIFKQSYFDHIGNPIDTETETGMILGYPWSLEGGNRRDRPIRFLSFVGIDAGDGVREQAIWQAVAKFHRKNREHFGRVLPRYGEAATRRLMRFSDLKPGEWQRGRVQLKGDKGTGDWILNPVQHGGAMLKIMEATVPNCLLIDPNSYKTYRNNAWLAKKDADGTLTLFKGDAKRHEMYSMQQCSQEYRIKTFSAREYQVWEDPKKHFADREFLDTTTGCFALASFIDIVNAASVVRREKSPAKVPSREEAQRLLDQRSEGGRR